MRIRALKYLSPLLFYLGAYRAFTSYGIDCYVPLIYAWILIPILEMFIEPEAENLSIAEEEMVKDDHVYDLILYTIVILLFPTILLFLSSMSDSGLTAFDKIGRIGTMGLLCGTLGINVGHELGHRKSKFEQVLAKMALMSSLYMHFIIEHNKGHHKRVATREDPSSARYGETVYAFWIRSAWYSYVDAWAIANAEVVKRGWKTHSLKNEMVQMHLIQLGYLAAIVLVFGTSVLFYYVAAAIMGILLLETVNYIEHYGLQRKELAVGRYQRAMPEHSWNSNHLIGRLMLFELSRHSDHHYLASRKYQVLRHHDGAPQMPTGYPGMMMLSLVPPLWFFIMHRRIKNQDQLQVTSFNSSV